MKRRSLLAAAALSPLLAACGQTPETEDSAQPTPEQASQEGTFVMPAEEAAHQATWVAYVADPEIWGQELAQEVKRNLAELARTIARFEPVHVAVNPEELDQARELFEGVENLTLHPVELNDFWLRDSAPVFVRAEDGSLAGINFNFNGWGQKQEYAKDARAAQTINQIMKTPQVGTSLVLEGGALEVDGAGSLILTESCVLNDNRNPGVTKQQVEQELRRLLGVQNIIWLPGIAGQDITDGHTDFYARFAGENTILAALDNDPESFDYEVTRQHLEILRQAKNPQGQPYRVIELPAPSQVREDFMTDDFAAGYINYYACTGAIILPQFGDPEADEFARATLAQVFPDREIVQLAIDGIAAGGGGIHCSTQQVPGLV